MNNTPFDLSVDKENKIVHITRVFDAGLDLVWDAWTTAELLDKWWAPRPFVSRTKYMNFENGGKRFYAMVSPEGQERWQMQQYSAIDPKTTFKMYSNFSDKDGNLDEPGSDWTFTFTEENDKTTVGIAIKNESLARMEKMIEMGFAQGFAATMQQLNDMLPAWAGK
jgi:uncharacterized protein YndB with AHSA1/START domain